MNMHAKIDAALTADDIALLFAALPDADQVRLIARLSDHMTIDTDELHDALRGMAEDVSGFSTSDDYCDAVAADDIYPGTLRTQLQRDLYREHRDRMLDYAIAHVQRKVS